MMEYRDSDAAKPQNVEIMMEKGGKETHYGTQKTKREGDWGDEETNSWQGILLISESSMNSKSKLESAME